MLAVAFEPCRSTDAEQTDRIVTNILADYKTEVHPKAKDDGGVVMKISLVPLHIAMVQPSLVGCCDTPYCESLRLLQMTFYY